MAVYQGKRIVYLWRLLSKQATVAAANIAFQTDGSESISNDVDVTKTKSGSVTVSSGAEVELDMTVVAADLNDSVCDEIKKAAREGCVVECWKVNLDRAGTASGTFKGTYYQGKISSYEESYGAEDHVEIQVTFNADGVGADGDVTVSDEQQDIAGYVFTDTPAKV
ncbi:MAG: phage major tail protein, TP901-1 family [Oscillospiraceae bacterium]|nr:phage major tail protein, TP901-1 family [Oscillospiraceae bacterium]